MPPPSPSPSPSAPAPSSPPEPPPPEPPPPEPSPTGALADHRRGRSVRRGDHPGPPRERPVPSNSYHRGAAGAGAVPPNHSTSTTAAPAHIRAPLWMPLTLRAKAGLSLI